MNATIFNGLSAAAQQAVLSLERERDKLKTALEGIHEHCLVETPEQTFERCRKAFTPPPEPTPR